MDKEYAEIKDNIIAQAKYYLESADEFYPFGAAIDKDHEIKPVGIFFGEEMPSSTDIFNRLENALKDGIEKNEYLLAAIGLDVYINVAKEKKTALEIRVYNDNIITKHYVLYSKQGDKYYFQEYLPA